MPCSDPPGMGWSRSIDAGGTVVAGAAVVGLVRLGSARSSPSPPVHATSPTARLARAQRAKECEDLSHIARGGGYRALRGGGARAVAVLLALGLLAPMAAAGEAPRSPGVTRTTLALVDRTRPTAAQGGAAEQSTRTLVTVVSHPKRQRVRCP